MQNCFICSVRVAILCRHPDKPGLSKTLRLFTKIRDFVQLRAKKLTRHFSPTIRHSAVPVCKNCSSTFDSPYCGHCGQRDNNGRFTFKEVVGDFVSQVLSLELPLLHTIRELVRRPGGFCRDYIQGKRRPFVPPIPFFILLAGFHVLVRVLSGFDPIANQRRAFHQENNNDRPAQMGYSIGHFISDNLSNFFFLLVFSLAFYSWLFFRKSRFNYAENTVLAFYTVAVYTLLATVSMLLSFAHPKLYFTIYLFALGYFTWVLVDFHRPKLAAGIPKAVIATVVSYVTYILSAIVIGTAYYILIVKK